jgi:hypothetical protein
LGSESERSIAATIHADGPDYRPSVRQFRATPLTFWPPVSRIEGHIAAIFQTPIGFEVFGSPFSLLGSACLKTPLDA